MSVVIKTKLNTINKKLDDIDAAVKSGKKKIADALIFNDISEALPNSSNPNSYMTFQNYKDLIISIKTRTSPMKLVFDINSSLINARAKSTDYKRTIILPVTGISGFNVNSIAREVIDNDTNDYSTTSQGAKKSMVKSNVTDDPIEDHIVTDVYGNECVDGNYIPTMTDIGRYLEPEQQEEMLEAMDDLGIMPLGLDDEEWIDPYAVNPNATYDYMVEWGDGSINYYVDGQPYAQNKAAVYHTYAEEGKYMVKITGNFRKVYSNNTTDIAWIISEVTQTDKDGLTLYNHRNLSMMFYLTEIRNFGNTLLTNCSKGFCRCFNLKTLPSDLSTNAFVDVTNFSYVFSYCTSLQSLPYDEVFETGLFSNCTKCTSFERAFQGCAGLKGNIPLKLMDGCTSCKSVHSLFNECTNLKGALINGVESIPSGLIAGMKELTTADGMFKGCIGLNGCSITGSKLFRDSPKLTGISALFRGVNVVGKLEREFFPIVTDENGNEIPGSNSITNINQTFSDTGITQIAPDAFAHLGSDGIKMKECFKGSKITEIPEGLFSGLSGKNLKLERAFTDCTSLTTIAPTALKDLKVANARGMFAGCTNLASALPEANSDWGTYRYIKKWYGAFADCDKMPDISTTCLELGGDGDRKYSEGKVGAIALDNGTLVDPKNYIYDSNNKPVGVVYADMHVNDLNANRANGVGNVNDNGTGIHKIYATVLNGTTRPWTSAQNYVNDINTINNTTDTSVSYGNYKYSDDGTTQTLQETRYDGEAYFDALRKWVFANGYYQDALPKDGNFVFDAPKGIYTMYGLINNTSEITTVSPNKEVKIYFLKDGDDEFKYKAYTWDGAKLVEKTQYNADLKTMSSTRYPAMTYVNGYSDNGIEKGKCFLPDASDLWDQFTQRHLINKAINKIIAGGGGYTSDNAYPMKDGAAYWASAENSGVTAWISHTHNATVYNDYGRKWVMYYVRPSLAIAAQAAS